MHEGKEDSCMQHPQISFFFSTTKQSATPFLTCNSKRALTCRSTLCARKKKWTTQCFSFPSRSRKKRLTTVQHWFDNLHQQKKGGTPSYDHEVSLGRPLEVVGQSSSGILVEGFLKDEELAWTALSCHLSMDLPCRCRLLGSLTVAVRAIKFMLDCRKVEHDVLK